MSVPFTVPECSVPQNPTEGRGQVSSSQVSFHSKENLGAMHVIKKETSSTCIKDSQFKSAHAVTSIQGVIKNLIPVGSIIMLAACSSDMCFAI